MNLIKVIEKGLLGVIALQSNDCCNHPRDNVNIYNW